MIRKSIALVVLGVLFSSPTLGFRRVAVGDRVDDFALVEFGGDVVKLYESLGERATVIVFWALWNPRSDDALRDLQELHFRLAGDGLEVVAVNVEHEEWDTEEYDKVARHIKERQLAFPVVVDHGLTLFDRYGVTVLPSFVITDRDGRVLRHMAGYPDSMRRGFAESVEEAVGTSPSASSEG